jgi:hypothetical protein
MQLARGVEESSLGSEERNARMDLQRRPPAG